MNYLKKQNGVTLISLVVTIIVLVILSTMITHAGLSSIKNARIEKLKNELEIIQQNISVWYEENINLSSEEIRVGTKIPDERKNEFQASISAAYSIIREKNINLDIKTDINRYRYFGKNEFTNLQIDGIENEYIIDIKNEVAIFVGGYEYEGEKYYVLDQIKDVIRGGSDVKEIVKVSSLVMDSEVEVPYQEKKILEVQLTPKDSTEELTWSSSNESIVKVNILDQETNVTHNKVELIGQKSGTAVVKVSNQSRTISKECTVTVTRTLVTTLTSIQSKTMYASDKYGNDVIVPKGFKYIEGETIDKGIVIQDTEGNQFVWIPVSSIDTSLDNYFVINKKPYAVQLARYGLDENGIFKTYQTANMYKNYVSIKDGNAEYKEMTSEETENTKAKDLAAFISSVQKNNGFFYARYEASQGSDGKAKTKANLNAWTQITQQEAAKKSREMYDTRNDITTDLINSYAWSTVAQYITQMGEADYIQKSNISTTIRKTGQSGDKMCNIYDLAGNLSEWATETAIINSQNICSYIGGSFKLPEKAMIGRSYADAQTSDNSIAFRMIMYMNN